uniref:Putative secreted protein n=1 Tax=Ixodes ricinus TaxID=34613 RepID=A0A6B0UED8_IXORI
MNTLRKLTYVGAALLQLVQSYFLTDSKFSTNQSTVSSMALVMGVNLKSGRYLRNLALLAVFLNWPSALEVSKMTSPLKLKASVMRAAASLMLISSASSTERMIGSTSS